MNPDHDRHRTSQSSGNANIQVEAFKLILGLFWKNNVLGNAQKMADIHVHLRTLWPAVSFSFDLLMGSGYESLTHIEYSSTPYRANRLLGRAARSALGHIHSEFRESGEQSRWRGRGGWHSEYRV